MSVRSAPDPKPRPKPRPCGVDPWTTADGQPTAPVSDYSIGDGRLRQSAAETFGELAQMGVVFFFAIAFTALLFALASTIDRHNHTLYSWRPVTGSTATAETFLADYAAAVDSGDANQTMRARGWVLACDECEDTQP